MKSKANIMILKADNQIESKLDRLKWTIVFILVLAGLFGNHYYSAISMPIRVAGWAVLLVAAGVIAAKTQKGRWAVEFCRESRVELRKVIWPTREEVTQTTLVVAAMVVVLALILWGVDGVLVWLVGWLTGQRG